MFPWTHYVAEGPRAHVFSTDTCETCGGLVEAPNAVGMSVADARRAGLVRLTARLPEQWYNEDLGACDCDHCHVEG